LTGPLPTSRSSVPPKPQNTPVIVFKPSTLIAGYTRSNAGHSKLVYTIKGSDVEFKSPDCNPQSVFWRADAGRARKRTATYVITAWGNHPYNLDCEVDAIWNPKASEYYYAALHIHINGSARPDGFKRKNSR
jgi:hypothetical protein